MHARIDRWRWRYGLLMAALAIATVHVCSSAHAHPVDSGGAARCCAGDTVPEGAGSDRDSSLPDARPVACPAPQGSPADAGAGESHPDGPHGASDCGCPCVCHTPAVVCAATCLSVTPTRAWLPADPSAAREARIPEPFERPPRFLA